jgi:RNA polymerase sigma-70 factor (ECF subfamily)
LSDLEIIDDVLAGNTAAFETLVNRHKAMAFTMALRFLKSRENAEEIVQDAFLKAFSNLGKFRREAKFSTWLYRIVFNLCASVMRTKKPVVFSFDDENTPEMEDEGLKDVLAQMESKDNRRMIGDALLQLDGTEAAIVTMFYYDDAKVEEISVVTGLSESNVKVKLFRARKKLYIILNKMFQRELEIKN